MNLKNRQVRVFCLSLSLLALEILQAEPRTFTSPDGRTLQAEILAATPDRVTLKTSTGQTLVAPVDKFIPSDQEDIAAWRKANPAKISYRFVADFTKSKEGASKSKQGNIFVTTERWVCNLKLINQSGQTLEDVSASYRIFFDQLERGEKITRSKAGRLDLGTLKALQQVVVKTDTVDLQAIELEAGYYFTDGSRARQKEGIKGVLIDILHEGKKVFTWVSPGVPKGAERVAEGTGGSLSNP
jgi:hypothetical protein